MHRIARLQQLLPEPGRLGVDLRPGEQRQPGLCRRSRVLAGQLAEGEEDRLALRVVRGILLLGLQARRLGRRQYAGLDQEVEPYRRQSDTRHRIVPKLHGEVLAQERDVGAECKWIGDRGHNLAGSPRAASARA